MFPSKLTHALASSVTPAIVTHDNKMMIECNRIKVSCNSHWIELNWMMWCVDSPAMGGSTPHYPQLIWANNRLKTLMHSMRHQSLISISHQSLCDVHRDVRVVCTCCTLRMRVMPRRCSLCCVHCWRRTQSLRSLSSLYTSIQFLGRLGLLWICCSFSLLIDWIDFFFLEDSRARTS